MARIVASHEPIDDEVAFDRRDRAAHPRVGRGQEAGGRQQQQACVQLARAVRLDEGISRRVEGAAADLLVNRRAHTPPAIEESIDTEPFAVRMPRSSATQAMTFE